MRLVEIKTKEQQSIPSIHRIRDLVMRQRTQVANLIRSLLRASGHILPTGIEAVTAFQNATSKATALACPNWPMAFRAHRVITFSVSTNGSKVTPG